MANYDWRCQACNNVNEAGLTQCQHCECPSTPNTEQVETHAAKYKATLGKKYCCSKCNHDKYLTGEVRTSGGSMSAVFDLETKKFHYLACQRCGYSEFFLGSSPSLLGHIGDWNF
jgi:predicted nucleic-acid-binding Zn-ribbon protein